MDLNTGRLGKEAMTQGAAMSEASLAELPGVGTLQVWRGQREDVLEIRGTWRAQAGTDPSEIYRRLEDKDTLVYEGALDDPSLTERQNVRAEVRVSSMSSYHLGDDPETPRVYVNFLPTEPEQVAN